MSSRRMLHPAGQEQEKRGPIFVKKPLKSERHSQDVDAHGIARRFLLRTS